MNLSDKKVLNLLDKKVLNLSDKKVLNLSDKKVLPWGWQKNIKFRMTKNIRFRLTKKVILLNNGKKRWPRVVNPAAPLGNMIWFLKQKRMHAHDARSLSTTRPFMKKEFCKKTSWGSAPGLWRNVHPNCKSKNLIWSCAGLVSPEKESLKIICWKN